MADERTGTCISCQERDPLPELAPVCGVCRSRTRGQLVEIPDLCAVLAAGPRPELQAGPAQLIRVVAIDVLDDGLVLVESHEHHARPITIAAGAIPGPPAGPRVAAAGDAAPVPVRLDTVDLLAPARRHTSATVALAYPEQDDDQIGHLSAATVLDGWCRDLAETRRETVPRTLVYQQCRYLLDRLDWACTEHPAVDELATEIGHLWSVLRRAAGLAPPQPELCEGVPCRNLDCDLKTLYRVPGSRYIECASCGMLLTDEEYDRWVKLLAAAVKRPRSAA